ncbi:MAG TPA: RDD family protein [Spirochaetota bacterium]|nr:RDD family protein [Spirochaetota bacterium]
MKKKKQKDCDICTFWQRAAAFAVDIGILVLLGMIIGAVFNDWLATTGAWGRLVGFAIAAVYFAIGDSELTGGKTPGKKITGIKVVNILGEPINVLRCFMRASVLLLPFFLYGIMLPPSAFASAATVIITFVFLGVAAGLVYFYIFNHRTRQAFHDIAAGTYVAKAGSTGKVARDEHASRSVPVVHFIVFLAVLLVILSLSLLADYAMKKPFKEFGVSYDNVIRINSVIADFDEVYYSYMDTGEGKIKGMDKKVRYLECFIYVYDRMVFTEENAEKMAQIILSSYNDAQNLDIVFINFEYGFDIGIARDWEEISYPIEVK